MTSGDGSRALGWIQAPQGSLALCWVQGELGAGRAGLLNWVCACAVQRTWASQLAHFRTKGCKQPGKRRDVRQGSGETPQRLTQPFQGFQLNSGCSLLPLTSNEKVLLFWQTLLFSWRD